MLIVIAGNCRPDAAALRHKIAQCASQAQVVGVDAGAELLRVASDPNVKLILVNRQFDQTAEDGLALIETILKPPPGSPANSLPKVMLISNYAWAQEKAVALGALQGFGKAELQSNMATDRIKAAIL